MNLIGWRCHPTPCGFLRCSLSGWRPRLWHGAKARASALVWRRFAAGVLRNSEESQGFSAIERCSLNFAKDSRWLCRGLYVSCTTSATTSRPSGSCMFRVPLNPLPGNYELRLFSNNGFVLLATSNPLTYNNLRPTRGIIPVPVHSQVANEVEKCRCVYYSGKRVCEKIFVRHTGCSFFSAVYSSTSRRARRCRRSTAAR